MNCLAKNLSVWYALFRRRQVMSVNRLSTSDTERGLNDVPLVEFMYLQMMYLWWSLCTFNGRT